MKEIIERNFYVSLDYLSFVEVWIECYANVKKMKYLELFILFEEISYIYGKTQEFKRLVPLHETKVYLSAKVWIRSLSTVHFLGI